MQVFVGSSLAIAAISLGCGKESNPSKTTSPNDTQQELPTGLSQEDYNTAERRFLKAYGRFPSHLETLSVAAELALANEQYPTAIACFQQIPSDHPEYGHLARHQQGFALLKLHRAHEAEAQLREFLQLESDAPHATPEHRQDAMQRLRYILEVELRFKERRQLLKKMHDHKLAETFDTIAYCFPTLLRWNGPQAVNWCEEFWEANPNDPLICAALARYRVGQGRMDEARELLQSIPNSEQNRLEVAAAWLYLHSELGDWTAMEMIIQTLPPVNAEEPWLLLEMRGLLHNRQEQFVQAETCFKHLLQADPANAAACQGLVQTYLGLDRPEDRKALIHKAEVLGRIQNRLGWVREEERARAPLSEIADLCRQIDLESQAEMIEELLTQIEASPSKSTP